MTLTLPDSGWTEVVGQVHYLPRDDSPMVTVPVRELSALVLIAPDGTTSVVSPNGTWPRVVVREVLRALVHEMDQDPRLPPWPPVTR